VNLDKEREEFEAWYLGGGAPSHANERNADGGYKYMAMHTAWGVWKARASQPTPQSAVSGEVPAYVLDALRFYAESDHFMLADPDAWDTVSGEPQNFLCDEAGTATVEDGSVAKAALSMLSAAPHAPAERVPQGWRQFIEDVAHGPQHLGYIQGILPKQWMEFGREVSQEARRLLSEVPQSKEGGGE
jgi:hypothetical protein